MKKKFNLILSCASLLVTAALLVLTVFSWYVVNQEVNVTGIVANTADENLNFTLYYYDNDESDWVPMTEPLKFEDKLPGDATYFKLACENTGDDRRSDLLGLRFEFHGSNLLPHGSVSSRSIGPSSLIVRTGRRTANRRAWARWLLEPR